MNVTEVETTIRDCIAETLGSESTTDLALDAPLLEGNILDSVGIYELVVYLEERYRIEILDEEVVPENFSTISLVARLVETKR